MFQTSAHREREGDQQGYRGAEHDLIVRGAGFLTVLGGAAVLLILPFYPPTRHLGMAGWIVALTLCAASIVLGVLHILLRQRPSLRGVFLSSFIGLAQLALIEWLAGGGAAPYIQLALLPTLGAASSQPPRRCAQIAAAALAAALSPAIYSRIAVASTVTEFTVVAIMTLMTATVLTGTRAHRSRLKDDRELAREQAQVDPVTGLPNRRAFDEALSGAVVERSRGTQFSLVLCDVDSFKQVNDTFGHDVGDDLLRIVAHAVSGAVRKPDAAFRWAGDEFAVLLRDSDASGASLAAARIREAVEGRCERPDGAPVTIGTGIAELQPEMTAKEAFSAVDQALCTSKSMRQSTRAVVPI